jgi:hypothetical protein
MISITRVVSAVINRILSDIVSISVLTLIDTYGSADFESWID